MKSHTIRTQSAEKKFNVTGRKKVRQAHGRLMADPRTPFR